MLGEPAPVGQLRLLEPLAATLRRFVPEGAEDDGLFGPRSMVWRAHRDRSFILAGVRSLLMQALHPLAMAGVAQHSDYRRRPLERLRRTAYYVGATAMGDADVGFPRRSFHTYLPDFASTHDAMPASLTI